MKPRIARVCFAIGATFFFLGFFVLCYCPGWYGLAAGFAGVAAWRGMGRVRTWSIVLLVASLIMTGLNTYGEVKEHRRFIQKAKMAEQQRRQGTNTSEHSKSPSN